MRFIDYIVDFLADHLVWLAVCVIACAGLLGAAAPLLAWFWLAR